MVVTSLGLTVRGRSYSVNLGAATGEPGAEQHDASVGRNGCRLLDPASRPRWELQLAVGHLALAPRRWAIHGHDRRDPPVGGLQMGPARQPDPRGCGDRVDLVPVPALPD